MEAFYAKVRGASEAERARLLGLLEEGVATLTKQERSLFERALRRVPTGTLADEFAKDVAAGTLPEVSYLVPSAIDSEHPSTSSPVHSATIVYKILDALGRHPDVWRHTAVLINYDENDGFFDHVPPPVAPPEVTEERWKGRPTGLGIRVPLLVVSPWTVGGYVCSEVFDHTSVIRFLERWTGVEEPNIGDWRRRVTGDLTSAFDFARARGSPPCRAPGPSRPSRAAGSRSRPPSSTFPSRSPAYARRARCPTGRTPRHGGWRADCGWSWRTAAGHRRISRSTRTRASSRPRSTRTSGAARTGRSRCRARRTASRSPGRTASGASSPDRPTGERESPAASTTATATSTSPCATPAAAR
ncbi:hypothetical protein SBADM41S_11108 [Streptomyces badius]